MYLIASKDWVIFLSAVCWVICNLTKLHSLTEKQLESHNKFPSDKTAREILPNEGVSPNKGTNNTALSDKQNCSS